MEDAVLLLTTNNKWVVVDCKGVVCLQPWISSVKVGALVLFGFALALLSCSRCSVSVCLTVVLLMMYSTVLL